MLVCILSIVDDTKLVAKVCFLSFFNSLPVLLMDYLSSLGVFFTDILLFTGCGSGASSNFEGACFGQGL